MKSQVPGVSRGLARSQEVYRRSGALLVPATAWLLWALWEWVIAVFSPEADIRVDLLLIIPIVLILSGFGIAALFFKRTPAA